MTRLILLFVFLGCSTRPNPEVCHDDLCIDPSAPFCDVDGSIGGEPGRCIAVTCTAKEFEACQGDTALVCNDAGTSYDRLDCPAGCDPQTGCRPFCTPMETLGCVNNELSRCNEAGTGTDEISCPLGCAADKTRCNTFEPSNGLGPSLVTSGLKPDVVFPPGTRVDTDTGAVRDANNVAIPALFTNVPQVNAPTIMAFEGRSFVLNDVTFVGSKAVAFVAAGTIEVRGRLSLRAEGRVAGPGASTSSACRGGDVVQYSCVCSSPCATGAGGGGGRMTGGRGGASPQNGGLPPTGFELAGGCSGGSQFAADSVTLLARGGGGGGAIQFVAGSSVTFKDQGLVDVGGGGGLSTTGGGSGGLVIIEAPILNITGVGAGVVANGGAGGGCGMTGPDALMTASQAIGATCPNFFAGNGGTGGSPPGNGCIIGIDNCQSVCPVVYGGGGGAGGRLRIVTKDGSYGMGGSPLLSAGLSTGVLTPK